MDEKQIEEMRVGFLKGLQAKAREYADVENSISVQAQHMMASICNKIADAFVFDVKMSAEINNIKSDIEAIRRVLNIDDKKTEEKEENNVINVDFVNKKKI